MGKSALIIGDIQNGIVANFGNDTALLDRTRSAIEAARKAELLIVFIRVGFREGHPDVSPNNKMFSGVAKAGAMLESDASTQLHDAIAPQPGDVVVIKRRVGGFVGTDLDLTLRSRGIDSFAIGGIATSGVVLSTIRMGADLDYAITVLSDITKDADEEVHKILMEKLFPRQADVKTVGEWIADIGR